MVGVYNIDYYVKSSINDPHLTWALNQYITISSLRLNILYLQKWQRLRLRLCLYLYNIHTSIHDWIYSPTTLKIIENPTGGVVETAEITNATQRQHGTKIKNQKRELM